VRVEEDFSSIVYEPFRDVYTRALIYMYICTYTMFPVYSWALNLIVPIFLASIGLVVVRRLRLVRYGRGGFAK
jgi:hypothetical protein